MAVNTLNTRIQLKYDTLANWITSTFKPLKGEVCIAEIPSTQEGSAGMTPPAIGIKIGDGTKTFNQLAWIQAVAGDVYSWAKHDSIDNVETHTALTNLVSETINDTDTQYQIVSNENKYYLQSKTKTGQFPASISEGTEFLDLTDIISDIAAKQDALEFDGTYDASTNKVATKSTVNDAIAALDVNNITGFGAGKTLATLTEVDGKIAATFQDIEITKDKVTDAGTAIGSNVATAAITDNDSSDDLTTKAQVATYVANKTSGLAGAMHYRGVVVADPTETAPTGTYNSGDVVTFGISEYVFDGTNWRELGTEGSYAVKGSIIKNDLSSDLQNLIDNKVTQVSGKGLSTEDYTTEEKTKLSGIASGAQVNVIEKITVPSDNGSDPDKELTITNKTVKLAKIAETNSIYDTEEANHVNNVDFLVINCGSATTLINNINATTGEWEA